LIPRWSNLNAETRVVVAVAVGFVVIRTSVSALSGFGFHQGWNEGHYAMIGQGFLQHPLVPRYAGMHVYSVPPLFPYTVATSFVAFGESVVAARLPSIVATGGLIGATYALGCAVFDDRRTALLGAVILATLPYVQLYGGRTQTDALMVCLVTAALAAIVRGYNRTPGTRWLVAGGALFAAAFAAKQPAILLAPVVLLWLVGNRRIDHDTTVRTGVLVGSSAVFLLPLAAWFTINYAVNPTAFVGDWERELFSRTSPFANVPLLVAIGAGLGLTPAVLVSAAIGVADEVGTTVRRLREGVRARVGPTPLTWWLVIFGAFVLYRTPHGHQYYALVLAPPVALFTAHGIQVVAGHLSGVLSSRTAVLRVALTVLVLLSTVSGTVVLFELSGEFSATEGNGTHVAADTGYYLSEAAPENATILVENGYKPPIQWYVRGSLPPSNVKAYHFSELDRQRVSQALAESEGPVYLIVPRPAWGDAPTAGATKVYRSEKYRYALMALVGSHVDTNSKFAHYLNSRQLVIYRFEAE
jgi:4-amino-4-deoxy-L-arabinose transferase-like glycosyltransferase